MKVLHIINTLAVGGAERLLVDALPIMKSQGVDARVLMLFSSGGGFEKQLREAGVEVEALGNSKNAYDLRIPMRLRSWLRDVDVVHAHLFPTQYWAALAHIGNRRSVLVTTEHSTSNTRAQHWLTSKIDKCFYSQYDGIICISQATADALRPRVPKKVDLRVIENGVVLPHTETYVQPTERESVVDGLPADAFVALQVARFSDQKNQDCVIRALKLLPPDVHVLFAGYGNREAACRQLAEREGVADRAHFLGMREDIARLWSIADIGIMSSHWEGFGLAAVEGMAYSKTVLASDVPGLADVVGDKRLLFTPDDERMLAKKVMSLHDDKDLRSRLGEECLQQAHKFDINTMVARYVKFYEELLQKKNVGQ